jgi:hypothetical protein
LWLKAVTGTELSLRTARFYRKWFLGNVTCVVSSAFDAATVEMQTARLIVLNGLCLEDHDLSARDTQ